MLLAQAWRVEHCKSFEVFELFIAQVTKAKQAGVDRFWA